MGQTELNDEKTWCKKSREIVLLTACIDTSEQKKDKKI